MATIYTYQRVGNGINVFRFLIYSRIYTANECHAASITAAGNVCPSLNTKLYKYNNLTHLRYELGMRQVTKIDNNCQSHFADRELDDFARDVIYPILAKTVQEDITKDGSAAKLRLPVMGSFFIFIAAFGCVSWWLPNSFWGELATFLAFPVLFLSILLGGIFLFRNQIADMIIRGKERFLIRTQALNAISKQFGVDYVPVPGGPNSITKAIAQWRYCPHVLKDIYHVMDDHGGFDDVSDIIRASGLAMPSVTVLGSEESRDKYYKQQVEAQQFEDGFKGKRGGIEFSALEWVESHDESSTHHLLLALTLPTTLTGRVEFKNKAACWPRPAPDISHKKIGLLSKQFTKAYKVRASDQMEAHLIFDPAVVERLTAYSAKDAMRGVAFDNHLVIDLAGDNRFDILDLATGLWSEQTIKATLDDFEQMLGLVDSVAHAFSVKAS